MNHGLHGRAGIRSGPAAFLSASLAFGALLAGCGASTPPMPRGGCGLEPYEWLPRDQVGQVVSFREDLANRLSAETIDLAVVVAGAAGLIPPASYGSQLFHLRYTTQDRGQPVQATGLVAVPWREGAARQSFPMVLFLHGTTGYTGRCAPSRTLSQNDVLPLVLLAAQGYVAVAPDYIGLDADQDPAEPPPVKIAYLGIEQTAIGSLDMVRAVRDLFASRVQTLAAPSSRIVLWGGSQGGHAAFSVDLVAPYYAPELSVLAMVAVVPATDLLGFAEHAISSPNEATPYLCASLTALHRWYRGTEPLDALFTEEAPTHFATEIPRLMDTSCDLASSFEGATSASDIFQPTIITHVGARSWDALVPWSCYLRENSMATTSIRRLRRTPTLFILAEADAIVHPASERASFTRLCAVGYELQYLECAGAGHIDGALWSIPEQLAWLRERLAGKPIPPEELCRLKPPTHCSAER
jgi:pimeloyl-ACP methyl ester carboxylesterase